MVALLAVAAVLSTAFVPPTLDPTYGMPVPRIRTKPLAGPPDAHWIWGATVADNQTIYLRRRFEVRTQPRKATLFITVDNYFTVDLDGQRVGETAADKGTDEGWHTIHAYDVTSALTPGSHEIRITATNTGGPAGVLVRLEGDGRPLLLSDRNWQESDSGTEGTWHGATDESPLGQGPWGANVTGWPVEIGSAAPYLQHLVIEPVHVGAPMEGTEPGTNRFVVDFGKELSGRIAVTADAPTSVTIGTGESYEEAINQPWTKRTVTAEPGKESYSAYTALRYACLTFNGRVQPVKVHFDHDYYPVAYKGSFNCSDPLLTKIWYTGAYTAHLCMQEDIWDAPKRDRARWMGDLHVSGETINNAFLDTFLMEQTMRRLREDAQGGKPWDQQPQGHVNGIPGYSCAWIAGLTDFYNHTGDLKYIKDQHDALIGLLEYMRGDLDSDGVFANKHGAWPFVDWSPDFDKDTAQTRAATHLFFTLAAKDASYLLAEMGDQANAAKYADWSKELAQTAESRLASQDGTFGDRRETNAMAIYSGVADAKQQDAIYANVLRPDSPSWNVMASPYYNNYVIFALSQSGHNQDAMNFVRNYWGGMIAEGATSFWEAYDPSWPKQDFHRHLNADDGTGYFVSLCHGWSSGATDWLTECVLGVHSTGAGFKTCTIRPDLGDLAWVEGDVPTPRGPIHVRAEKTAEGKRYRIKLPPGVKASIFFGSSPKVIDSKGGTEVTLASTGS